MLKIADSATIRHHMPTRPRNSCESGISGCGTAMVVAAKRESPFSSTQNRPPWRAVLRRGKRRLSLGSYDHRGTATRNAALARIARTGGHVVSDCRRVGDLQHLRGGVLVLRGQEYQRADATRSSSCTVLQLHLSVLQQLHNRDGGACHRAWQDPAVRDLVAADHCAGCDLHPGYGTRVVRADLPGWTDHQLQPVWNHVLLAGGIARLPRAGGADWTVHHTGLHRSGIREAGARGTDRSLRHVLALRGRHLGGGAFGGVLYHPLSGTEGKAKRQA